MQRLRKARQRKVMSAMTLEIFGTGLKFPSCCLRLHGGASFASSSA